MPHSTKKVNSRDTLVPVAILVLSLIVAVSSGLLINIYDQQMQGQSFWIWIAAAVALALLIVITIDRISRRERRRSTYSRQITSPKGSSLHQLPPPPLDFTGRTSEFDELWSAVQHGGVVISALQGLGGIGKTTLALKLAEKLTPEYPDAQLFLDLRGNSKQPIPSLDAMTHVIRSFYPSLEVPKSETELAGLFRSTFHERHILLLMDNAASKEQVEPLIPPTGCIMLVTSRQHFTLPGMFAKNLDAMATNEATKLLRRISPRVESQALEIAELCGCLPLALRVVSSILTERPDLTVTECISRLKDSEQRFKILGKVEASLRLSFDLLDQNLQRLWAALAVFEGDFDVQAVAAVWEVRASVALDTVGEFLRYSLLEWNTTTQRYKFHDLVRIYAANQLTKEEAWTVRKKHASHFLRIAQEANMLYQSAAESSIPTALDLFDRNWTNIQAGQSWSEGQMESDLDALRNCSQYPDAASSILALRRHPSDRVKWFACGVEAAEKLRDKAAKGRHQVQLGRAFHIMEGRTERVKNLFESGLALAREVGDRAGEGQALGSIGVLYRESGKGSLAIPLFEERLRIAEQLNDKRGLGNTLGNLGITYLRMGNPERCTEYCNQQLETARAISDRGNEARALGNLGSACLEQKNYKDAITLFAGSLEIQETLGNRRGQGGALGNLGKAYEQLKDFPKAKHCYERSLNIQREAGYKQAEGYALGNLGRICNKLEQREEALEYHRLHFAIAHETDDKVAEASALYNMSFVFEADKDLERAIDHAERSLQIFESIEDPRAAHVRNRVDKWNKGRTKK